ncbi:C-terminal processing peptidase-2 [Gloeomargarita lithophora Alchichica-D10]|uniref:C-terminal processing peptidase n=1 Tax=Gloeomargarita lithophora Alchichica-D10 TaxID=1188229 RepID=A0A1J0ABN0_9CYAN|nr:S41 family peptidase [Gloeomargarita lithophora]APB33346.1 C-terminal processing peptidase-2 [Gloeomargarita lithophora Alchichica-D10]
MKWRWGWWLGLLVLSFTWIQPALALTEPQRLVVEVWHIVNRAYVEPTFNGHNWQTVRQTALQSPPETMVQAETVIQEMLGQLDDPFTRVLPQSQYRNLQTTTAGELTGVGLQIVLDTEQQVPLVVAPISGSPAAQAGIQSRDRILAIDGASTLGMDMDTAASRMRGLPGTRVVLTLQRGERRWPVTIERQRVVLPSVVWEVRPGAIGYIQLSQFSAGSAAEMAEAIQALEAQGVGGYVLDLRNNPGGLFQAGLEIAQEWLNQGTVVYTVNRDGLETDFTAGGKALTDKPLVVLVNHGTASASEILAGALQDNHRATLVGETTFGKGLIQSVFKLSNGDGLAVSVARYETPAHHNIHRRGIVPDQEVPTPPETTGNDPQYQAAVAGLTKSLVATGS